MFVLRLKKEKQNEGLGDSTRRMLYRVRVLTLITSSLLFEL